MRNRTILCGPTTTESRDAFGVRAIPALSKAAEYAAFQTLRARADASPNATALSHSLFCHLPFAICHSPSRLRPAASNSGLAGRKRGIAARAVTLLVPLALLALSLIGCSPSNPSSTVPATTEKAKAAKYHCPMHPTYLSDRPGDCPICGMRLVLIGGHETAAMTSSVPGRVSIVLSPEKRNLIGLSLATVERRSFNRTLRAYATLSHDETRFARIAPRFGGWVRSLQVNYTWQEVEKGQPLFTVYSPELHTAESEYLLTFQNYRRLTNSPTAQRDSARNLLQSARRRLELLQVGDEEVRALEERGQPSDELQIRSPISGHVTAKTAVEGKSFAAGDTLYEVADLTHLWVRAYVFEYELPDIHVGQAARVIFPHIGNKTFETTVSFISPHVDPQTRRVEVRLELINHHHELRPDMWADVEFDIRSDDVLTIPASAVIDTGPRNVAFVEGPNDLLEPREVTIGARSDDYLEVRSGLKEGEKVVTRALFLVDSESQLKAAIAGMAGGEGH